MLSTSPHAAIIDALSDVFIPSPQASTDSVIESLLEHYNKMPNSGSLSLSLCFNQIIAASSLCRRRHIADLKAMAPPPPPPFSFPYMWDAGA
jgi:hypothetical protein